MSADNPCKCISHTAMSNTWRSRASLSTAGNLTAACVHAGTKEKLGDRRLTYQQDNSAQAGMQHLIPRASHRQPHRHTYIYQTGKVEPFAHTSHKDMETRPSSTTAHKAWSGHAWGPPSCSFRASHMSIGAVLSGCRSSTADAHQSSRHRYEHSLCVHVLVRNHLMMQITIRSPEIAHGSRPLWQQPLCGEGLSRNIPEA